MNTFGATRRRPLTPWAVLALFLLALAGSGFLLAARTEASHGKCVGMFLETPAPGARLPSTLVQGSTNLTVNGTVPCLDSVMAWSRQGPYRVFEDGTVEFLAAPMPPCPNGDFYVWISFPK